MSMRGPADPTDPAEFLTPPPSSAERKAKQEERDRLRHASRRRLLRAAAVVALLAILIVFVLQNAQPVRVNVLFLSTNLPLIWVIVLCAAIGGVVGYLVGRPGKGTASRGGRNGRARTR